MGVLQQLREAIDRVVEADPHDLGSAEDTLELATQLDRLEGATVRSFGSFDASNDWMPSRAYSAAHWLAWKRPMHLAPARRRRDLARALRSMPATEQAWLDGELTIQHVVKLAQAQKRCPELFERDEKLLLDNARDLSYNGFSRSVDYWVMQADPEGAEERAAKQHEDRFFDLVRSFEDCFFANGMFDPISGTIVYEELCRLERELFEHDWAEAKARLGRDPHADELRRTSRQRRHDALVEMSIRSRMAKADGERPAPLFTILVGYETFHGPICELADRMTTTPGSLVDWLDDAWIERVVFDGPSRVMDVGAHRRLFTGADRRALQVRDLECFHPGCEIPAQDCEGDHIQPFAWGGLTLQENGRMACPFHNRARHRRPEPPA